MRAGGLAAAACVAGTAATGAAEHVYQELELEGGGTLRYAIVLPDRFDPTRPYPALLALPPGQQTEAMVEAGLRRYWGQQAAARGWIVVSPEAPEGRGFFTGAETAIPPLLDAVAARYRIEGGVFHLAGASNGGRSALRVGTLFPGRFASLTVLPGFPPAEADWTRLASLREMPVALFVGGADDEWLKMSERTHAKLVELGIEVSLTVLPGEGHVPPSLDGEVMMDHLEGMRRIVATKADRDAIGRVLDDFHDAAAKADGERYFGQLAAEAVFLGTDATERWTVPEFRVFAMPYFERGSGWTYVPTARHVVVAPGSTFACFDELLENAKYGPCRGTGAIVRVDGTWKIAQYGLSITVPNEHALSVVAMLREAAAAETPPR